MKSKLRILSAVLAAIMVATAVLTLSANAEEIQTVYVNDINNKVTAACGTVLTKDFNGTNNVKASSDSGNFLWAYVLAAKPTDKANVFEVTYIQKYLHETPEFIVGIPQGGFIYAAHCDNSEAAKADGSFQTSEANFLKLDNVAVGDLLTISGINLTAGTIQTDAVIYLGEVVVEEESSTTEEPSDESSASSEPDSSTSNEDSSTEVPKTGDTGTYMLVISAILAMVGLTYISAKRRKANF